MSRLRATPSHHQAAEMALKRKAFGSTPFHSPPQSPVRKQMPDYPETWYCLENQATLTEDREITPLSPHAWKAPVVEDVV